jgi:hypothetical protein
MSPEHKKLEKLCKNKSWKKVGEICQMTPEQKLEFFFKMSLVHKAWETFPMEPIFHITAMKRQNGNATTVGEASLTELTKLSPERPEYF